MIRVRWEKNNYNVAIFTLYIEQKIVTSCHIIRIKEDAQGIIGELNFKIAVDINYLSSESMDERKLQRT